MKCNELFYAVSDKRAAVCVGVDEYAAPEFVTQRPLSVSFFGGGSVREMILQKASVLLSRIKLLHVFTCDTVPSQ